jgi:hypothetical protein
MIEIIDANVEKFSKTVSSGIRPFRANTIAVSTAITLMHLEALCGLAAARVPDRGGDCRDLLSSCGPPLIKCSHCFCCCGVILL